MLLEVLADAERAAGAGQHDAPRRRGRRPPERTASSSASLVATSRLFIASGRLRVMVATPSDDVEQHGGVASCRGHACRLTARQRTTNRSAPGFSRVASSWNSSAATRPGQSRGQQRGGQPGVGRRGTCATRARGGTGPRTPPRPRRRGVSSSVSTSRSAAVGPRGVRRGERAQVPGAGGVDVEGLGDGGPQRCRRRARRSTVRSSGRPNGLTQTPGAYSANPRKTSSARSRVRARPVARRVDEHQSPPAVPRGRAAPVDPVRRLGQAVRRPGRWRGSPGPPAASPAASQPCATIREIGGAHGGRARSRPARAAAPARRPAPGCRGCAGGRRTRRTAPSGRAWRRVCLKSAAAVGDTGPPERPGRSSARDRG